jgi:uncharacterized protein YqcC (DUF446 family)
MTEVDVEEVRKRLGAVIEAMRAQELFDLPCPADSAFESMGAFGMNTMTFAHWLRWVFVAKVQEALDQGGPWPKSSSVAVIAAREGDTDPRIAALVQSLAAFDALFEEPSG